MRLVWKMLLTGALFMLFGGLDVYLHAQARVFDFHYKTALMAVTLGFLIFGAGILEAIKGRLVLVARLLAYPGAILWGLGVSFKDQNIRNIGVILVCSGCFLLLLKITDAMSNLHHLKQLEK